jgi:hypothetical protein
MKQMCPNYCGYPMEPRAGGMVQCPRCDMIMMAAVPDTGQPTSKEVKKMAEQFEERTGGVFWKPQNEGDQIEGTLLKVRAGQYDDVYDIDTKDGMQTVPSSAVLKNRISAADEGKYIVIKFDGLQQSKIKGRNPTRLFKVFFRK